MKLTKEQEAMLKEKLNKIQLDAFDRGAEFVIRMMKESMNESLMDGYSGVSQRGILDYLKHIKDIIKKRREKDENN